MLRIPGTLFLLSLLVQSCQVPQSGTNQKAKPTKDKEQVSVPVASNTFFKSSSGAPLPSDVIHTNDMTITKGPILKMASKKRPAL